jgi:RimK-like ATP-grasp domain
MSHASLALLWGLPDEEPLSYVHRALLARGARTVLLDQRRALSTRIQRDAGGPLLRLAGSKPTGAIALAALTAAYPRPYPCVPNISTGTPAYRVARRHVARLENDLWHWMATGTATVLNRPEQSASNGTKPFQTRAAHGCGFRVPDSLLTSDPGAALAFAERHRRVIYKGAGGTRTRTGLLDPADTSRLTRIGTCPVYLQRYIPGSNVRVHVVDMQVFATEIVSDAIDYRARVRQMTPVVLPVEVADRCVAVTRALGLLLAGLDLIRTPEGEWYFLEANTSPGFTFFPAAAQVAEAIARLLTRPPQQERSSRGPEGAHPVHR